MVREGRGVTLMDGIMPEDKERRGFQPGKEGIGTVERMTATSMKELRKDIALYIPPETLRSHRTSQKALYQPPAFRNRTSPRHLQCFAETITVHDQTTIQSHHCFLPAIIRHVQAQHLPLLHRTSHSGQSKPSM